MLINGHDCLIVIKIQYRETGVPYAEYGGGVFGIFGNNSIKMKK
jgi:hypothetical protein